MRNFRHVYDFFVKGEAKTPEVVVGILQNFLVCNNKKRFICYSSWMASWSISCAVVPEGATIDQMPKITKGMAEAGAL